jgi:hypothetical protein
MDEYANVHLDLNIMLTIIFSNNCLTFVSKIEEHEKII